MPTCFRTLLTSYSLLLRSCILRWIKVMQFGVLASGYCYKVFRAIICFVAVYMVNKLTRLETPIICFFPNKAMFRHISSLLCKMMAGHQDKYVPTRTDGSATSVRRQLGRARRTGMMTSDEELSQFILRISREATCSSLGYQAPTTTGTKGISWHTLRALEFPSVCPFEMPSLVSRRLIFM